MRKLLFLALMCLVVTGLFAQATVTVYEENFDASTSAPAGWVMGSSSIVTGQGVGGSNAVKRNIWNSQSGYMDIYSPVIEDLPANSILKFEYKILGYNSNDAGNFPVSNNTFILAAVATPDMSDYEDVWASPSHTSTTAYQTITVDLSDYEGWTGRLNFYAQTQTSSVDVDLYIDNISVTYTLTVEPTDPPFPATLVSPANGATFVPVDAILTWAAPAYGNAPTDYRVLFGTDPTPSTEVVAAGTDLTYTPTLNYNTTYYWQVIPHNANGYTVDAPIWSFTTTPAGLTDISIGSGSTGVSAPINPYVSYSVSQILYLRNELTTLATGGTIYSIGFQVNVAGSNFNNSTTWRVYMTETDKTSFADATDWLTPTALELTANDYVFDGQVALAGVSAGDWVYINLTTPFEYSGQNNLLVFAHEYSASYGEGANDTHFRGTSTAPNYMTLRSGNDSSGGAYIPVGTNPFSANQYSALAAKDVRPNIKITYTPISSDEPDLGITGIIAPAVIPGVDDILVTVMNYGTEEAPANGYTIEITAVPTDGSPVILATIPGTEALDAVDDGVYDSYEYQIAPATYNVWANWAALYGTSVTLTATVVWNLDENTDNDSATTPVTLRPAGGDLELASITAEGYLTKIEVTVQNNGWTDFAVDSYDLDIYDVSAPLVSLYQIPTTVALAKGESTTYEVLRANLPSTMNGGYILRATVSTNPQVGVDTNDSDEIVAYIFGHVDEVGISGTATNYSIPFNNLYRDNVAQSIYTQDELGTAGAITHIQYKVNMANIGWSGAGSRPDPFNVNIYMANVPATRTVFTSTSNWEPMASFTLVAEDYPFPLQAGIYEIWIELDEPFMYTGENLIVMTYKDHEGYIGSANAFFQSPNGGADDYVSLHKTADAVGSSFWPNLTTGTGTRLIFKPQTRFAMTFDGYGVISGVVGEDTDDDDIPDDFIEGVLVSIEGTNYSTTTAADGSYSIVVDKSIESDLVFAKFGWVTQRFPLDEIDWVIVAGGLDTFEQDVIMEMSPNVTVTGTVKYFDSGTDVPDGVTVVLEGHTPADVTDGVYTIPNVFVDADYTVDVTITTPGYENYHTTITIPSTATDEFVHNIFIRETFRTPLYVHAMPTSNANEVKVAWFDPEDTPAPVVFTHQTSTAISYSRGAGDYIGAVRFSATHLTQKLVAGGLLVSVGFIPVNATTGFSVMIWTGSNLDTPDIDTPTHSQPITQTLVAGVYNEIMLTSPVPIPESGELVIGFRHGSGQAIRVAGEAGDRIEGYTNKYYYNGAWTTIYANVSAYYEGWHIRGSAIMVDTSDGAPLPNRAFAGKYSVYRMPATATIDDNTVTELTVSSGEGTLPYTSDLFYLDTIDNQSIAYRYAVRSIYSGTGYSEVNDGHVDAYTPSAPAYSNPITLASAVPVTVNVSTDQAGSVEGALIKVVPGSFEYTLDGLETSKVFNLSPNMDYRITVYLSGYKVFSTEQAFMDATEVDAVLTASNVIFAEDFANGLPDGWTIVEGTADDNYYWRFGTDPLDPSQPVAFSESMCQDTGECVYPDNWLISPPISLHPNASEIVLNYSVAANSFRKSQERFFVYYATAISGTTPAPSDFLNVCLPNNPVNGWLNEQTVATASLINAEIFKPGDISWHTLTHEDLTLEAGNTVWLAFRHAHSADQDIVKLTDIQISIPAIAYEVTGIVTSASTPLVGLDVEFTNTIQQQNSTTAETENGGVYTASVAAGIYSVRVHGSIGPEEDPTVYDYTLPGRVTIIEDTVLDIAIPTMFAVSGNVLKFGTTSTAIAGATVTLTNQDSEGYNPQPATSAADTGAFTMLTVPGTYTLTVTYTEAETQHTWTHIADVVVVSADVTVAVNVGAYMVSGTVAMFGATPTYMAGAVKLTNLDQAGYDPPSVNSNASTGVFDLLVLPGTYSLKVTYTDTTEQIWYHYENISVSTANVPYVTVLVNEKYTVGGTIQSGDATAVPLSNATLVLTNTVTSTIVLTTNSNTSGEFTFTDVPRGSYNLKASGTHATWSNPTQTYTDVAYPSNPLVVTANNTTIEFTISTVDEADVVALPTVTTLKANYPNPFNPSTTISFDIASAGHVSIEVYNIKGQRVKSLVNDNYAVGRHNVVWNGDDTAGRTVGSGVYFYRMTAPGYASVRKMLLMK